MKRRWSLILPLVGLAMFLLVTYHEVQFNHELFRRQNNRYFYWSSIRLDSDPLNRHSKIEPPCKPEEDCGFEPLSVWVDPGWPTRVLEYSALPAFVIGVVIVVALSRVGISEVASFLISMPLLIGAWFYLLGWLIDRGRCRSRGQS
jgi:hypothetical protein